MFPFSFGLTQIKEKVGIGWGGGLPCEMNIPVHHARDVRNTWSVAGTG